MGLAKWRFDMLDGVCLPYSGCSTAINLNGITGRANGRTVDDLLTVVSQDLVGKMIPNGLSKTDKTTRSFMSGGWEFGTSSSAK